MIDILSILRLKVKKYKRLKQVKKKLRVQWKGRYMFLLNVCMGFFKITKNNICVIITTIIGRKTLLCYSIGQNILQSYATTNMNFMSRLLGEYIGLLLKKLYFIQIIIKIRGYGKYRKRFIFGIMKYNIVILYLEHISSLSHNGCRLKKLTRKSVRKRKNRQI